MYISFFFFRFRTPFPVEYRLRWVPGVGSLCWACIFHVYFMLFVHHFSRWLGENWPTQRQFSVEYGLYISATDADVVMQSFGPNNL